MLGREGPPASRLAPAAKKNAGNSATRSRQAPDVTARERIVVAHAHHDRDRACRSNGRFQIRFRAFDDQDVDRQSAKLGCYLLRSASVLIHPSHFGDEIVAGLEPVPAQLFEKGLIRGRRRWAGASDLEHADASGLRRCLCVRDQWRHGRAGKKPDEVASPNPRFPATSA
jgi:hypothetical protein